MSYALARPLLGTRFSLGGIHGLSAAGPFVAPVALRAREWDVGCGDFSREIKPLISILFSIVVTAIVCPSGPETSPSSLTVWPLDLPCVEGGT